MAAGLAVLGGPAVGEERVTVRDAVTGRLKPAQIKVLAEQGGSTVAKRLPWISAGILAAAQERLGVSAADERLEAADAPPLRQIHAAARPIPDSLGCQRGAGANVRVNQDCTFRRQAETEIAANPTNGANLVAGQNDSRVGFNQCGIDYSVDGGQTWGDLLPPFRQKLNNPQAQLPTKADPNRHTLTGTPGTFHTYDAGSDPTVAFDSQGRAFFSCIIFDLASNANGLYVTQSPANAHGSYFFNVGSPLGDRAFMVAEDNSPNVFHDKQFIAADTFTSSRNRDNVYVTWTVFRFSPKCRGGTPDAPAFCSSPIYGSMSTDHAVTWSTPQQISGRSPLCHFGNAFDPSRPKDACDFNQGSDPVVLPSGDLVVPFNNGNTAANNPNGQQLAVRCSPTGSSPAGTADLNCGQPTKVGDDVLGSPECDFGRGPEECIPGAFIRTNDFPRSAVSSRTGKVYVAWQDYRNQRYDIQVAVSGDGGRTWSREQTVSPADGQDHYFPAIDIGESAGGDRVAVSYYRTGRVPGENHSPSDGFTPGRDPGVGEQDSDYGIVSGKTLAAAPFGFTRLSPKFPPPDGVQTGFNGDYTGLVVVGSRTAYPFWSDTRNVAQFPRVNGVTVDEDVFTQRVTLP
ncbi:MAG TPA: hypothetical protein VFJ97_16950 [Dermatophilaceae bacterium]|nr:hypothetical protein [Dermatophilaceae bacterium]